MSPGTRPLWRGRVVALVGILLVSLSLRTVLAATTPIIDVISRDIPLDTMTIGIIGTLPPLCFALIGVFTPLLTRRVGMITATMIALGAIVAGHAIRATAPDALWLVVGTALSLFGMGAGNVLLAPMVKRYFPDRIALMTALYTTGFCFSTLLPPLVVGPVAEYYHWRVSLALWIGLTVAAAVPWIILLWRGPARMTQPLVLPTNAHKPFTMASLWRSPVAVALALAAGMNSLNSYTILAWYPQILVDAEAISTGDIGLALALNAAMGIPVALLLPLLARRLGSLSTLFWVGGTLLALSHLSVLVAPQLAPMAIMVSTGIGLLNLPVVFVLMPQRTETEQGTMVVSGFVNALSYGVAATGPILAGLLHEATGSWTLPLLGLTASSLLILVAAVLLRGGTTVEASLRPRGER